MSDLPELDLSDDVLTLTRALVDAPSVSGSEGPLADAVEAALRELGGLEVERVGDAVLARTNLGRPTRVVLAGHLDTVPIADNVPSELREVDGVQRLYGCGTTDMKAGDAVMLRLAGRFGVPGAEPAHDLTFVFYDNEEVEHSLNGLGTGRPRAARLALRGSRHPARAHGRRDRGRLPGHAAGAARVTGRRAHSARSWLGVNAIHGRRRSPRHAGRVPAAGGGDRRLTYREGLNAVGITGGVAGNVIPDEACAHGQLPLCARPGRGRRGGARPGASSPKPSPPGRRSPSPTTRAARCPGCPSRLPPPSSPPWAGRPAPSSAGPTSPGSPRSGFRRSTTGQGIRSSRTPARNTWSSTGCSRPRTP